MKYLKASAVGLLVLLAACTVLQQSFGTRLAAAYTTNTEIRATSTAALNAGRITSDEAQSVLVINDQARAILDAAASGDERGLALALEVMSALEAYHE